MATALLCILCSTCFSVAGQLTLKQGMLGVGALALSPGAIPGIALRLVTSPLVIAGLACYGAGSFFWLVALSRVELSFAYPFVSLSFALIVLASWYFFGETINLWRVAGVVTICCGVLLIARGGA